MKKRVRYHGWDFSYPWSFKTDLTACTNSKSTHTYMLSHSVFQNNILSLGKLQPLRSLETCSVSLWMTAQQIQNSHQSAEEKLWMIITVYTVWNDQNGFHEPSMSDDDPDPGFYIFNTFINSRKSFFFNEWKLMEILNECTFFIYTYTFSPCVCLYVYKNIYAYITFILNYIQFWDDMNKILKKKSIT